MAGPQVITLGCRLNAFESEIMRAHAGDAGLDNTVIINTCAVTAEAERQARQAIRRARRDNPTAKLIVTGCAAQLAPERFAAMPEVDRVLGNAEKLDPASYADDATDAIHVTDIMTVTETAAHLVEGFDGRARAFVQIQQGCDHRCTFCIIPFARGPNRSVPFTHLARQLRELVQRGYGEVVLTGVDICSYGADTDGAPALGGLVRRLLDAVPELARLRLSSLDPAAMDDELYELIAGEPRLMPHVHLSLQAMDDMVLKRMKRRHDRAQAVAVIERLRRARADVAIGADLIAGFPTETDAMFANTLAAVEDLNIGHLHVFPYSARPGTPAQRMPKVAADVIKDRAARLRRAGERAMFDFREGLVGRSVSVLVERQGFGLSEYYVPVSVAGAMPGAAAIPAMVTGLDAAGVVAEAA